MVSRETFTTIQLATGNGAFSVSASQHAKTVAYIQNQRQHHRKMDYKAEYIALLERHGVEYDKRYVFA